MATDLEAARRVHWNDDSASESDPEMKKSSKTPITTAKTNADITEDSSTSSKPSGSLSFEHNTFSGYSGDNESDTDEVPRMFPFVDKISSMVERFSRTLVEDKVNEIDSASLQWLKYSAMTSGESDVESVQSDDSALGVTEAVQTLDDQAADESDEEFFDLSSDQALQAKRIQFLNQVSYIQAILDQAPVSDDAAFNKEIYQRIQVHALEMAAIFGDDVQKLQQKVLDLTSTNSLQGEQFRKLQAAYAETQTRITRMTDMYAKQAGSFNEEKSKSCALETELTNQKRKYEGTVQRFTDRHNSREEKQANIIKVLRNESEELKTAHQLDIDQLNAQNAAQRLQYEKAVEKDQMTANEALGGAAEKLWQLQAKLETSSQMLEALRAENAEMDKILTGGNASYRELESKFKITEEGHALRKSELESELYTVKERVCTMEKQHGHERDSIMRRVAQSIQILSCKKDAEIAALEAEMKEMTRLGIGKQADFNEKIRSFEVWMKNEKFDWEAQLQQREAELRKSHGQHAALQQKLLLLHGLEMKNVALEKGKAGLKRMISDMQDQQRLLEHEIQSSTLLADQRDAKCKLLADEISNFNAELALLESQAIIQAEAKAAFLEGENADLKLQVQELEAKHREENIGLKLQVEELESKHQKEKADLQWKVEELEAKSDGLKLSYRNCTASRVKESEKLVRVENQLARLNHWLGTAGDRNNHLENKIQELESQAQATKDAFSSTNMTINVDASGNAEITASAGQGVTLTYGDELMIVSLREELAALNTKVEALKRASATAAVNNSITVAQLTMQRDHVTARARCLTDALEEKKAQVIQLSRTVDEQNQQLATADELNREMSAENWELREELAEWKAEEETMWDSWEEMEAERMVETARVIMIKGKWEEVYGRIKDQETS